MDDVICHHVNEMSLQYETIITVQPTSPLLSHNILKEAIDCYIKSESDTLIAVKDARHLRWQGELSTATPSYKKRVKGTFQGNGGGRYF